MDSHEPALCYHCGKEVQMPFRCNYCNLTFCEEHRLPEAHNCINLPERSWFGYKKNVQSRKIVEQRVPWMRYLKIIGVLIVIGLVLYYYLYL
jgi:hypothetical protein